MMDLFIWQLLTFIFGFFSFIFLVVIIWTYTNPLLRMYIKARNGKKSLVFWIDKNKRVTVKELQKKDGVWEVDGDVVNINPSHFFFFEKTPVLFYYGDLATSVPLELVQYIDKLKVRFPTLRELLKYQYEDAISTLDPDTQALLYSLLQTNTKEFIEKVKILGLKPKEEMFEFLINSPIYSFEDLLNFIQNVRLDYFSSAIEKKALSLSKHHENVPVWTWIIIILALIIIGGVIMLKIISSKPEVIVKVPWNETINSTVKF
jgi:hypothetical protein